MSSFHERQKQLFNQLKDAEDQYGYSKTNKNNNLTNACSVEIDKFTYRKLKHEMKQFRGRESIFKRAEANIRECLRAKTIPDHIKNPQRYTYYSLADVTAEQMSDATNTATALALLRKLEEQQLSIKEESDIDETGAIFKKPLFCTSATVKKENNDENKSVFKSSKVVMPEYVVGASQPKTRKEKNRKYPSQKGSKIKQADLKLEHLFEDDSD